MILSLIPFLVFICRFHSHFILSFHSHCPLIFVLKPKLLGINIPRCNTSTIGKNWLLKFYTLKHCGMYIRDKLYLTPVEEAEKLTQEKRHLYKLCIAYRCWSESLKITWWYYCKSAFCEVGLYGLAVKFVRQIYRQYWALGRVLSALEITNTSNFVNWMVLRTLLLVKPIGSHFSVA